MPKKHFDGLNNLSLTSLSESEFLRRYPECPREPELCPDAVMGELYRLQEAALALPDDAKMGCLGTLIEASEYLRRYLRTGSFADALQAGGCLREAQIRIEADAVQAYTRCKTGGASGGERTAQPRRMETEAKLKLFDEAMGRYLMQTESVLDARQWASDDACLSLECSYRHRPPHLYEGGTLKRVPDEP